MSDTTAERVKAIAPELTSFIDTDLNGIVGIILEDVQLQVTNAVYGEKEERAQRYLAAHLLTLSRQGTDGASSGASGPLKRVKVGMEEREYAISGSDFSDLSRLDETSYGRVFVDIRKSCVVGFDVIRP